MINVLLHPNIPLNARKITCSIDSETQQFDQTLRPIKHYVSWPGNTFVTRIRKITAYLIWDSTVIKQLGQSNINFGFCPGLTK